jgi:hypothetical protein
MRVLIVSGVVQDWAREVETPEVEKLLEAWAELKDEWRTMGKVLNTFYSPSIGLPMANQNGEWTSFKIFEVSDIAAVQSMYMAYLRSPVRKCMDCKFIVGKSDERLERE